MFYKIRNILCLTVLALLLVQTNITKLYAQGVVTLADNAENEDPALNQDIPDEIALFDDSIESEVPSEVPASGFGRCIESTRKSRNPGPKKQRAEKHYGNRRPRFLSDVRTGKTDGFVKPGTAQRKG